MDSRFCVKLDYLPEYGLRVRTRYGEVVHRFADDRAVPACLDDGGLTSEDPSDYKRERLAVVATTSRFSLCSHGACFGRLHLVDPADPDSPTDSDSPPQHHV